MADQELIEEIINLLKVTTEDNLGENFQKALNLSSQIASPIFAGLAEEAFKQFRFMCRAAIIGWRLFATPELPPRDLTNVETIQLVAVELALKEFCYGCEMIATAASMTWENSPPTRFYLNSFYHYASSLFLVDQSKESHKGLPMGGTIIMALHPIGLANMLAPIQSVLEEPFGSGITFGETIIKLRHSYLVHGEFSLKNFEYLVTQTQMRSPEQQLVFSHLIWKFFHQSILLDLKITAILTQLNIDFDKSLKEYMLSLGNQKK